MRWQWDKKLLRYALHALLVISAAIIIYQLVANLGYFISFAGDVWRWVRRILSPFLIGGFIAYVINPGVRWLEEHLYNRIPSIKKSTRIKRVLSIASMYLIAILFITMIFVVVTPRIVANISDIITNFPEYMDRSIEFLEGAEALLHERNLQGIIEEFGVIEEVESWIERGFTYVRESLDEILDMVFSRITGFTSGVLNFFIGLIMAFYLLFDKNLLKRNANRLLYALFSKDTVYKINDFGRDADEIFGKYIVGRSIDAFIIGCLCYVGLTIIGVRYRLLYSVIIGVTNLIPYFGPFLGGIPVVIVTMFSSFTEAFWVAVFILGLQQFDGLVLGPKILGDSVGIRPIWIILSIYVGGRLFGILGMFLGVPVFAIVVMFFERLIKKQLDKKGISLLEAESTPMKIKSEDTSSE